MEKYKSYIATTLDSYKCISTQDDWKILPVYDASEHLTGFLKPVTIFYKEVYPEYIPLVFRWRAENQEGFYDEFENTLGKTENWFDNILLPRKDRLLFFIHTPGGEPLGHLGVSTFDFENKSCEIDNVVRGVKDGYRGIMTHSTKTIINWSKDVLKVKNIYLRVFSDNNHAIQFYKKNNFIELYDIPLTDRRVQRTFTKMMLT